MEVKKTTETARNEGRGNRSARRPRGKDGEMEKARNEQVYCR